MSGGAFGGGIVEHYQGVDRDARLGIDQKWVDVDRSDAGAGIRHQIGYSNQRLHSGRLMQRRLDPKDRSRLLMSFMKVVAVATIADAVPLLGENRVFAALGLAGLRSHPVRRKDPRAMGDGGHCESSPGNGH